MIKMTVLPGSTLQYNLAGPRWHPGLVLGGNGDGWRTAEGAAEGLTMEGQLTQAPPRQEV